MKSMTGYGYCRSGNLEGIELSVEIRSVNRKQLDIKMHFPRELQCEEIAIRRLISNKVSRGSIYVKVDMVLSNDALRQTVKINDELAEIYINKTNSLKEKMNIQGNLKIKDIMLLPNVIERVQPDIVTEELTDELHNAVTNALAMLNETRLSEGLFLKDDLFNRIKEMEVLVKEIEPLAEKLPKYNKEKLQRKLEDEKLTFNDDDRLLRELVIYADRCDVSEEITRLKSHFIQFNNFLKSDKPVGRNMDFLTQEIQREINTLGVKSASTEISPKIVTLKTETEKIREQIQNIE